LASKSLTGEHHDVAELLEANEMRQRAADLAGTDQRDFVTRHGGKTLDLLLPRERGRVVVNRLGLARQGTETRALHSCIHYTSKQ
jgi:hypothetical protein